MLSKILCWVFGHKYGEKGKEKNYTWAYGSTWCMRCGYDKLSKERIYFSNGSADITKWDAPSYVDISKAPKGKYIKKYKSRVKKGAFN